LRGLDLAGWLLFVKQTATARRAGRAGIVGARRTNRPYPCRLFCYRVDKDVAQGRISIAEHFVAVDLLEPAAVLAALVADLDMLGPRLGCAAVRSIMHGTGAKIAGGLARAGHTAAGTLLFKQRLGASSV
jgi:hypothetical protein